MTALSPSAQRLVGVVLAICTASCMRLTPAPDTGIYHFPKIGQVTVTEIGESMFATARGDSYPGLRVTSDVPFKAGTVDAVLQRGLYKQNSYQGESANYDVSERIVVDTTTESVNAEIVATGGKHLLKYIIILPSNKETRNVREFLIGGGSNVLKGEIPLTAVEAAAYLEFRQDSFKRELVYTGVSGNTIGVLYREFVDGLARPAFSQELKYDLTESRIIGYKGARFEILSANNLGITFKVIRHLD